MAKHSIIHDSLSTRPERRPKRSCKISLSTFALLVCFWKAHCWMLCFLPVEVGREDEKGDKAIQFLNLSLDPSLPPTPQRPPPRHSLGQHTHGQSSLFSPSHGKKKDGRLVGSGKRCCPSTLPPFLIASSIVFHPRVEESLFRERLEIPRGGEYGQLKNDRFGECLLRSFGEKKKKPSSFCQGGTLCAQSQDIEGNYLHASFPRFYIQRRLFEPEPASSPSFSFFSMYPYPLWLSLRLSIKKGSHRSEQHKRPLVPPYKIYHTYTHKSRAVGEENRLGWLGG